ncbi:MAG TPA: fused MFS/spermidine synthase [Candidatus Methylomirabilis sp.]|nr:fused MFS/spermidine synthase [Candidatus Methylomirabilis sp.]
MSKYGLEITVFLSGAALMILELAGSRLLAPFVGTSLVVWTSLIGIIMGALSLGYYAGGKIADRQAKAEVLAAIILAAAFTVLGVATVSFFVLAVIGASILGLYLKAVIAAVLLFALPSFLLGIVSPYAVKLKINSLAYTGRTVGDLYALSTIGSIAGTFAAGFWLIPFFGTMKILFFIAFLLIVAAAILAPRRLFKIKLLAILILLLLLIIFLKTSALASEMGFVDVDSQYNRIWIYPSRDVATGRPVLRLSTDPFGIQSAMFTDRDDDLVFKYLKYYRLGDVLNPGIKNALMIGGAAYSYPKDFLKNHLQANLDVVEIDAKMTEVAKKYFNLPDDPRLKIYHEDARIFLNNNQKKYDAVYVDAFNSHLSVPYQLTTQEAVREIYRGLNDGGVAIVNIISAISGDKGKFLRAEYATYQSVFPQVYLFQVDALNSTQVQNLILIAVKSNQGANFQSANLEYQGMLGMIWREPLAADMPILTDDYAPVDYYTMNLF